MGSIDPGMFVISGRLSPGITPEVGEEELEKVIQALLKEGLKPGELQKVKNQSLTAMEFEKVEVINRAMNLAFAALSGDADLINQRRRSD
jgi:zinc protease